MNRTVSGSITLEALAAILASAIVISSGLMVLRHSLEFLSVQTVATSNRFSVASKISQLKSAYDQRFVDPFSNEPWLIIESSGTGDWKSLHRIRILRIDENEGRGYWDWHIPKVESIETNLSSGHFVWGEFPDSFRIRFPESPITDYRQGIAIHRYW